jgi:ELWxxDGT repeat protein
MKKSLSVALSLSLIFFTGRSFAQTWELFDLFTAKVPDPSSMPRYFTEYNGKMYFAAYDNVNGEELWVSDGTQAGTQVLKDIRPGTGSSNPAQFIIFKNRLFFNARDGSRGEEIWVTDGTPEGTQLFKDINAGSSDSKPGDFNILNGKLYFGATDGINGYELWSSDGTPDGTSMFYSFIAGIAGGYNGLESITFGNKLLFVAKGIQGYEPWITDGTVPGTFQLMDIYAGSNPSDPALFYAVGDTMVYFVARSAAEGKELYVTKGTIAGTKLLKATRPGTSNGSPKNFIAYNGSVFFRADDGVNGTELWVTVGTTEGTRIFMDIEPGTGSSHNGYTDPHDEDMYVFNEKLYFSANQTPYGDELWVSDGTVSGTSMLKDIRSGTFGSTAVYFKAYHDNLYFRASDGTFDNQLWRTDGTDAGTMRMVCDSTSGYYPLNSTYEYIVFQDALWFRSTFAKTAGNELWKYSDGPSVGIKHTTAKTASLKVYPNPGKGMITIELNSIPTNKSFAIMDLQGRQVMTGSITGKSTSIDISRIPAGLYFLDFGSENQKIQIIK